MRESPAALELLPPGGAAVGLPLLVLPLALAALAHRQLRAQAVFLLIVALITADLLRGQHGALFPLYSELPLASLFRQPTRMAFVIALAGAVLAGIGAHRLLAHPRLTRMQRRVAAALVLAALVGEAYWRNVPAYHYAPMARPHELYAAPELRRFAEARPDHQRFLIEDVFQTSALPANSGQALAVPVLNAYEPLLPRAYANAFRVPAHPPWTGVVTLLDVFKVKEEFRPLQQTPALLDHFSVRYYVDPGSLQGNPSPLLRAKLRAATEAQTHPVLVYERDSALPRAYVVHRQRIVSDDAAAIAELRSGRVEQGEVVVTSAERLEVGEAATDPVSSAKIESLTNNAVRVRVEAGAPGILILTDLHYPGWKAEVDGSPARIARVNGLFRGVAVPAGEHRVEFRYAPLSHRIGAALSVVGLCVALSLVSRRSPAIRSS